MDGVQCSVVIPVYNSSCSIEEVVERTISLFETDGIVFEIILVDDYSRDDSLSKINKMSSRDKRISIIPLEKNHGQQGAIKAGINIAKGEYIITMDDDLEHQPDDIIKLIEEILIKLKP